ncbi:DNA polymerase III subunit chi [Betaproteobacteria bacterium]|nr:DNA polymerase III subunit chi [Betaproteobacteria bacterium]
MTQIFFYHNAANRVAAAAALLGKACQQGKAVLVYAPEINLAEALNRLLWTTPPTGFVPHVLGASKLAEETPIVITADIAAGTQNERLLNLSPEVPPAFSRFTSVIEVIGQDDEDRRTGRERAKFYKDRGYAIKYIDFAEKSS